MGVGRKAPQRARAAYARALAAIPLPVRAVSAPVEESLTVLDRTALAALTKRLHRKHRDNRQFEPLKAEAMVRAIYEEPHFLLEVSRAEQPTCLWAVMEELVDPASSEAELDRRVDGAIEIGRDWLREAFGPPNPGRT